jgi:hypothetical protein
MSVRSAITEPHLVLRRHLLGWQGKSIAIPPQQVSPMVTTVVHSQCPLEKIAYVQ